MLGLLFLEFAEDALNAATRWIETDDPLLDGVVTVCPVRTDDTVPRDGIQVSLCADDAAALDAFHAFYNAFDHPAVVILDQAPGRVVLAGGRATTDDPRRFAIAALDALDVLQPALRGLVADEIRVAPDGSPRFVPRYREASDPDSRIPFGLAAFLEAQDDTEAIQNGIDALRDPTPEVRRTARARFAANSPAAQLTRTGELKVSTPDARRHPTHLTRVSPDAARAAVLIPPDVLRGLDPGQRSAAAGHAGVSLAVLDGLAAAGLPLVLESHRRSRSARSAADEIARETGLPVQVSSGGSIVALAWAGSLAMTGLATAFATFVLYLVGLTLLPMVGAALSTTLFGLSARTGWTWWSQGALLADARDAQRESAEELRRRQADPVIARGFVALAEARRVLAGAGLPGSPATDVRTVLKAAERELDELVNAAAALRRESSAQSSRTLEAKLSELREDDEPQRQRLQRRLERARDAEARQAALHREARSIEAVLDEVVAAVGRWEEELDDDALTALMQAAREARNIARSARAVRVGHLDSEGA